MTVTPPALNIVFAGTPAFTLPCLNALANSRHTLRAIYTQPDRPAGRGRKLQASAVKEWANQHQLPVHQPLHFKDDATIATLEQLAPDVMVVIAYGLILPKRVLDIPKQGCINVHASLLPRWRGASPIQHAILHGDHESGVTIMQMDVGMDTGDMLNTVTCPITASDTATTLHDKLAELAVKPLLKVLDDYANGLICSTPQNEQQVTYAPKINKEDAEIDWQQPAVLIDQKIRAFNPWPIAYTHLDHDVLRIHKAHVVEQTSSQPAGTVLSLDKHGMIVATGQYAWCIERMQLPGGKNIAVADWLNAGRAQIVHPFLLGKRSFA